MLHRDVKPQILGAFGDIATAIGAQYEPYFNATMEVLQQAGSLTADTDDYDLIDYINGLREGITETYIGLVQGLYAERGSFFLSY